MRPLNGIQTVWSTDRFPDFQEALRRIHPSLELIFDVDPTGRQERRGERVSGTQGWWAVARMDPMHEPFIFDGLDMVAIVRRPTVITHIKRPYTEEGFPLPRFAYQEPNNCLLEALGEYDREQFDFDNSAWLERKVRAQGERDLKEDEDALEKSTQDIVDDFKTTSSKTNPTWDKTHHTAVEIPA